MDLAIRNSRRSAWCARSRLTPLGWRIAPAVGERYWTTVQGTLLSVIHCRNRFWHWAYSLYVMKI